MMTEPEKKIPWWAWVLIILFPIPIGVGPWWLAIIFIAAFAVLVWAILQHPRNNPSE